MNEARLSLILKDMLVRKGVKNLVEFVDLVSKIGLELANTGSLSARTLQNSLVSKDRSFFASNKISRISFYKTVVPLIKKESSRKPIPDSFLIYGDTPFDNQQKIRHFFTSLSGIVYWKDKQFSRDGLLCIRMLNFKVVKEVRVLTGYSKLNNEFKSDYLALQKQLQEKDAVFTVRVLPPEVLEQKHDRIIIVEDRAFDVPPANNLFSTKEDGFYEIDGVIPKKIFEIEWRSKSMDLLKSWTKVQKFRKANENKGGL